MLFIGVNKGDFTSGQGNFVHWTGLSCWPEKENFFFFDKNFYFLPELRIGVVGVIIVGHFVSTEAERELDDDDDDGKSEMICDGELSNVISSVWEDGFKEILEEQWWLILPKEI